MHIINIFSSFLAV